MSTATIEQHFQRAQQAIHNNNAETVFHELMQVIQLEQKGQYALKAGHILSQIFPHEPQVMATYGQVLINSEQYQQAVDVFADVTQKANDNAMFCANYGYALHKSGELKHAHEILKRAVEMATTDEKLAIQNIYVDVLVDRQDYDAAENLCQTLLAKNSQDPTLLTLLGNIQAAKGNENKAIESFESAIAQESNYINARYNCGRLLEKHGKLDVAISHYHHITSLLAPKHKLRQDIEPKLRLYDQAPEKNETIVAVKRLAGAQSNQAIEILEDDPPHSEKLLRLNNISTYPFTWELFNQEAIYLDCRYVIEASGRGLVKAQNSNRQALLDLSLPRQTISQPCILLGGCDNYYHWLLDYLPRLRVIEQQQDLKEYLFLVTEKLASYQIETLNALGINASQLLKAQSRTIYDCQELIVPIFTDREMDPAHDNAAFGTDSLHPVAVKWLRDKFLPKDTQYANKRLFLTRSNAKSRRCVNEEALIKMAQRYDFEVVDNADLTFAEQVKLYAQAEIVIGVHGAAFTNTVFMPEGGHVIELTPGDTLPRFYQSVADRLQLNHHHLEGQIVRSLKPMTNAFWDFDINIEQVEQLFKNII